MSLSTNTSSSVPNPRPRAKQACLPCRRKKSKCPGQRPVCAHCARLRQPCSYDDRRAVGLSLPKRQVISQELSDAQTSLSINRAPATPELPLTRLALPPWVQVSEIAQLYLQWVESQPFPLFHHDTFLSTLQTRDMGLVYALLAVAGRFSPHPEHPGGEEVYAGYRQIAHRLVMEHILSGDVVLWTLQTLVLLATAAGLDDDIKRLHSYISLLVSWEHVIPCSTRPPGRAGLEYDDEALRCRWSIVLLQKFYWTTTHTMSDFLTEDARLREHAPRLFPSKVSPTPSPEEYQYADQGIMMAVIHLSEVWSQARSYVRSRGHANPDPPPWSYKSAYSQRMSLLLQIGASLPSFHRYAVVNPEAQNPEDINADREYWAPWFLSRFLYHTTVCLLNHPLLVMLCARETGPVPEIHLQQTSSLITHHTRWISDLLILLEEKAFRITDPIVGYCAAIVATIELQLQYTGSTDERASKKQRLQRCIDMVEQLGAIWPALRRLSISLHQLIHDTATAYQQSTHHNTEFRVRLSGFWEVLEFPTSAAATTTTTPTQSCKSDHQRSFQPASQPSQQQPEQDPGLSRLEYPYRVTRSRQRTGQKRYRATEPNQVLPSASINAAGAVPTVYNNTSFIAIPDPLALSPTDPLFGPEFFEFGAQMGGGHF
ncbi:hypothetical protein ASPACDRAFT_58597 [Aspergillus aculeatus ATCC 16872]|uniref:Zn(2)-C6 fungal-type domain-containing protein n=1 Tax=Aspergillus aculeatus (strain ATCC 16872 / CBS 172.66 / WB 5094) TaxID=690307 RepID=A0A1L9X1D5_ASPA1|nr:uncharacterized protein ASPACDRAFT_58597 [Aspergillus aculeatus ATCC 16872]OJK02251.1 hypothetical protein ASPACDRAFT_58597 [Aspergillus aculeatus ATCC 16872]